MILVAALALSIDLTARAARQGGEYLLEVSGRADAEAVALRFRRRIDEGDWASGRLVSSFDEGRPERRAIVDRGRFVHVERFDRPGEVEVEARLEDGRGARRTFRIAPPADAASSIRAEGRRLEKALAEARGALEEGGPAPRRLRRAKAAARQAPPTAAGRALDRLMADVALALEIEASGRSAAGLKFSLTGEALTGEGARTLLVRIEAVAARERALLAVREMAAVVREPPRGRERRRAIPVLRDLVAEIGDPDLAVLLSRVEAGADEDRALLLDLTTRLEISPDPF